MPIPNPSSPGVSPVEWPAEGGVDDSAVALVVLLAGLLAGLLVEVEVMVGSYVVEANEHLRTISFASIKISIMRLYLPCHQKETYHCLCRLCRTCRGRRRSLERSLMHQDHCRRISSQPNRRRG